MPKLPNAKTMSGSTVLPPLKQKRSIGTHINRWLLLILIVLAVFEVLITSNQATNGGQLAQLQAEQAQLTEDITRLERQASQISSLSYIRQYATEKLGMQPVDKNVLYHSNAPALPAP